MQDGPRYAVGLDIGTTTVRAVVGHVTYDDDGVSQVTVVGTGEALNGGMRKGVIVNLLDPARAIDTALGEAERISGHQVNAATISINGSHILTTHADGMIAAGSLEHEITVDDVERLKEVATIGKVPPNRQILDIIPHAFRLDGQDNIRDPLGMIGTRLEVNAHIVSALSPYVNNLRKVVEEAHVEANNIVVSGVAAARAVLSDSQRENGVALVDIGGSTTNVSVYEDGDLQYVGVIPIGGINISNDLAIGLRTDLEVAEIVKKEYASALLSKETHEVNLTYHDNKYQFSTDVMGEIVEARLDELFDAVQRELKRAGRAGRLPGGVVLTGGTAELRGIIDYAKNALGLSARIGTLPSFTGVADDLNRPQYATAFGLMLLDRDDPTANNAMSATSGTKNGGLFSRLLHRIH